MAATFRPAVSGDTPAVAALAAENGLLTDGLDQEGFGQLLRWLHDRSRSASRLQVVGEAEGEIVAHYGAMPIKVMIRGREVLMGLASNLVIAEKARKSVSFFALQNYFHKQYQALAYDFLCGCITRPGVLEPHLRAGWKKLGSLPVFVRPISLSRICAKTLSSKVLATALSPLCSFAQVCFDLLFGAKGAAAVTISELKEFLPEHDDFLRRWQESQEIASCRNASALNWRFFAFPERGYRVFGAFRNGALVGYAVARPMPMKGYSALALVDIVVFDGDKGALHSLLAQVLTLASILRVDLIATVVQPSSWVARSLRLKGFLKTPQHFTFVTHQSKTSALPLSPDLFSKWYVTWLEHDFV